MVLKVEEEKAIEKVVKGILSIQRIMHISVPPLVIESLNDGIKQKIRPISLERKLKCGAAAPFKKEDSFQVAVISKYNQLFQSCCPNKTMKKQTVLRLPLN
ncbi:hypothetical protein CDAR_124151 [Caerostris darwini]|uniref:Uncharacterized protein n=1 Tax=Caerostris darwini TaxID=1538125 RepID=A0AAV4SVH1_9ARAC|nr:hypothetical protein CDAR_124151 [Caerostris darwini]